MRVVVKSLVQTLNFVHVAEYKNTGGNILIATTAWYKPHSGYSYGVDASSYTMYGS